jgi:hypothetical protein
MVEKIVIEATCLGSKPRVKDITPVKNMRRRKIPYVLLSGIL